jgi:hypothetical protein
MNNYFGINIEVLEKQANEIAFYFDVPKASKLYKKIEGVISEQNLKEADHNLYETLIKIIIKLKIVSFSILSDEEAADILRNHYLESYKINMPIDIKNGIEGKLFMVPYLTRDELREKLKKALSENGQRLGHLTLGQWINEFDKNFSPNKRKSESILEFITGNPLAQSISAIERNELKELLYTYDRYLIDTFPLPEPMLSEVLKTPNVSGFFANAKDAKNTRPNKFAPLYATNEDADNSKFIQININDALKKYPEAGEQLITSQKIELKNFYEPVRPSVKNWLADYVHLLGYEDHDAIERANYLFHTTNTRNLPEADRERVAYILKAFDEKSPIDIDPERKQIVFPIVQKNPEPLRSAKAEHFPLERGRATQDPPDMYEAYRIKNIEPEKKLSAGKMFSPETSSNIQEAKFNFPQKMPYEKEQEKKEAPVVQNLQPYRITSSAIRRNEDRQPDINPNNVINLKNSKL